VEVLEKEVKAGRQCAVLQTASSRHVGEVERAMAALGDGFDGRWWQRLTVFGAHEEMCKVLSALYWAATYTAEQGSCRGAAQRSSCCVHKVWLLRRHTI
jgi:hypothetical protein